MNAVAIVDLLIAGIRIAKEFRIDLDELRAAMQAAEDRGEELSQADRDRFYQQAQDAVSHL